MFRRLFWVLRQYVGKGSGVFLTMSRIARENNLDLANIQGTGKDGRVLKADVLGYLDSGGVQESVVSDSSSTRQIHAFKGVTRLMKESMTK